MVPYASLGKVPSLVGCPRQLSWYEENLFLMALGIFPLGGVHFIVQIKSVFSDGCHAYYDYGPI